ncbi:MAG: DeoR/GlpR transcriptional regulator [Erysipelotrichaceae bacterium]|nr:DeoR/GlpR transcriptional regulator [Erysipelotrichaceae bacterium]
MKVNRIAEMEASIRRHKMLSNEELCEMFSISMQTLRRDLKVLEERGSVSKVYGGVVSNENQVATSIPSLHERLNAAEQEKMKIGKIASSLIEEHDVIFVDSGTTASRIIPYLNQFEHVTIVTHSLHVLAAAAELPNLNVICLGGQMNHETRSFQIEPFDTPYLYTKAFIATVGIDEKGCTNTDLLEGRIKQHVLSQCKHAYLVADHSKFHSAGFNRFAKLDQFEGIITDQKVPETLAKTLNKKHIRIYY